MVLRGHGFVVIVRRWQHRGPRRVPGAWMPAGTAGDALVATTMADVVMAANPDQEAKALSRSALVRELSADDRERVVELLGNPTTADVERRRALHEAVSMRLASSGLDRRAGTDRRSGRERRYEEETRLGEALADSEVDRRSGRERRAGRERRRGVVGRIKQDTGEPLHHG
jgi:hypothetical protein